MDRYLKRLPGCARGLLRAYNNHAITDVLRPHRDDVTASLRGIKQQPHGQACLRTDWVLRLELGDFFFGPAVEAVSFWQSRPIDPVSRIVLAKPDTHGELH